MFKNHNDLNIDDSDIVQIEENRKKEKSGNQIMIKKLTKTAMYHSHIFCLQIFTHISIRYLLCLILKSIFTYHMVYLKIKVFSLLIHAVYKSIDHCKNTTTTTTDDNNKNYDKLCNFFSLIIANVNT